MRIFTCISIGAGVLAMLFPLVASAHATPVAMEPASSAIVDTVPKEVTIHFSEHVDPSASKITIESPSMTMTQKVSLGADRATLSTPVMDDGNGTYVVSWSVVSADDGHFTKGAYAFAVGKGSVIATTTAATEIVEIATTPEAFSMTVELMGNGIIWAALFLLAFALRPLLANGRFVADESYVRRSYATFLLFGIALALVGGALQLWVKSADLASLQGIALVKSFPLYAATTAGFATIARMFAVLFVLAMFLFGMQNIWQRTRISGYEIAMMLGMCVFAYCRAIISHATANPFHPGFSITVNFFHLIEKDVWAGITLALLLLAISRRMRPFLIALVPRAFQILAVDFAAVSVTATYIVWLHLKSFDNLFTSQWGVAFLELLIAALALVAIRTYHVTARVLRPSLFTRWFAPTIAVECAFALLVVYYSSVVIITSPPLPQPATAVFSSRDQGVSITLERDQNEDGMLMLELSGGTPQMPVMTIENTHGSAGAVSVDLLKRFAGGYVFAESLMTGSGPFNVAITVPQQGGYDAHANFTVPKGAFDPQPGWEAHRVFDSFTICMIVIALAALGYAVVLYRISSIDVQLPSMSGRMPEFSAAITFLVAAYFGASIITSFYNSPFSNPFKAECTGDGNMWHLMQPTRAGVAVAQSPTEGCMWGMGNYMYMFPDQREYDANKSLGEATVTIDKKNFTAGVPVQFTVSLKNADGTPATLFVDMEKLLHVVIVSKDETIYAHIHPDDLHPLTRQEINTSTFTLNYTFPKSGEYLVMVDYAHGVALESQQFVVHVAGDNPQHATAKEYPEDGDFNGYHVAVKYSQPFSGEVTNFFYTITNDGKPVTLVPYLSAGMHIAAVKNDLSWHFHAHGEVHVPGTPYPPIIIKNGQVVHSMAAMYVPDTFDTATYNMDAHVIFPSSGLYTIWGQFKTESGDLVASAFTVRVEQ